MFAFFKARAAKRTRRHARLWRQSLIRGVAVAVLVTVVAGAGIAGSNSAVWARLGDATQKRWEQATVALGFQVSEILVVGRHRIQENELLNHLGVTSGTPVFAVDLAAAQQLLHEIRWVEKVTVSRRLPDKIIVTLQEREPVALWQYKKKISLIDATGFVIADRDLDAYASLPLVVGEDAPLHVRELAQLMKAEPAIAAEMASATRVGQRRWDLRLKNGIEIRLPENNVELALSRLVKAARDEGLLDKNISVVDLRIPEKLTVTPKAGTATQTAESADAKKKNI